MVADLLDGLSPDQAEAVTTDAAPLAVVAGPGSGKTRVLTRRVAWRVAHDGVDPARVMVVTFSHRAASELVHRLRRLGLPAGAQDGGVMVGTFHALAFAELARHRGDRRQPPPAVTSRPARLMRPLLAAALGRPPSPGEVSTCVRELSWARAHGAGPDRYVQLAAGAGRRPRPPTDTLAAVWRGYERAKRDRRVLDLDDLLEACTRLLATDAEAAGLARWRHRHLFVDEYQDLNPAHRRLLGAWVGGRPDVCLVGDPDQAVYGFNGASPDLFDRVARDWPGVRIVGLADNFRSTPEIVAMAEAIRPSRPVDHCPVAAVTPVAPVAPVAPGRGAGRSRLASGPLPTLAAHTDEEAEATAVAGAIAARRAPGRAWSGMAVLARTNLRLRLIAAALDRADVPWRLRDPRPLADLPAVHEWLAALPPEAPARDLDELLADELRTPDRAALQAAVAEHAAVAPRATVGGFASWLDATGVTADEAPWSGVDLATFHRAKGLEWRSVWVVGVEEEDLVPIRARGADVVEEQRLLYVALTRAEDELAVSWATQGRTATGALVWRRPSRWVPGLVAARISLAAEPDRADQRARLARLRHAVAPAGAGGAATRPRESDGRGGGGVASAPPGDVVDGPLRRRQALIAWRAARARAACVPPSLVLGDRALADLVQAVPAGEEAVVLTAGWSGRRAALWAPELVRLLTSLPAAG